MKNQFLVFFVFLAFLACKKSGKGDLNDFTEISIENLTPNNAPEGLILRDTIWQPDKGWELVPSKDGQRVMLLQTGTDTGSAGYECKCNAGAGKCAVRKDIVMCKADVCTDCSTVLKIYNGRVSIDRAKW